MSGVPFSTDDIAESGQSGTGNAKTAWVRLQDGRRYIFNGTQWELDGQTILPGVAVTGEAMRGILELTEDRVWSLVTTHAKLLKRALLWGPPGTGKSFLARTAGVNGHGVYPVPIHSDLPAAELRGHYVPQSDGSLSWHDGPVIAAWRGGGRLVLDEINTAGDDTLSFLLAALDNHETARMVLGTTGEILSPHPDFTCWATMNAEPDELPDALRDRFPVIIKITSPNPAAIDSLPEDLRSLAAQLSVSEDRDRRIGLRKFIEFARLRDEVDEDVAAALVWPDHWADLKPAIRLGRKADTR